MINLHSIKAIHFPAHVAEVRGLSGLADGLGFDLDSIDFTSLGSKALDVLGSAVAKQPSVYVSPNDPRYRAQPPQNVYTYAMNPNAPAAPAAPKTSGVGFQIDQKTLILAAGALLIFLVASKR